MGLEPSRHGFIAGVPAPPRSTEKPGSLECSHGLDDSIESPGRGFPRQRGAQRGATEGAIRTRLQNLQRTCKRPRIWWQTPDARGEAEKAHEAGGSQLKH